MNTITLVVPEIKKALRPMAGVVNSSTVLPILEDALFEVSDTVLKITVTDLETIVTTTLAIPSTKKQFMFCVNFKLFKSLIDRIEGEQVSLTHDEKRGGVVIISKEPELRLQLPSENTDNYPKTFVIDKPDFDFSIAAQDFIPYLKIAGMFVSNDDLRPSMTGICMSNDGGKLQIVATDAHRLYKKSIAINNNVPAKTNYIIPQKSAWVLSNLFKKGFTMRGCNTHIECFDDSYKLIFRCIDARYPDWPMVWPKELPHSFYAKRKQLKAALVLALPYTNRSTNQITFTINGGTMFAKAAEIDCSIEFEYKMPVYESNEIGEFSFALNQKFMLAALQVTKDENVRVRYESGTKAFIIDDDILIMPLMLNN